MRAVALRSMLLVFVAIAATNCLFAAENESTDYLPLKQGSKWSYDAKVNGISSSMIIRVAKFQTGSGRVAAQMETVVNGMVTATEYLGISDDGIYRLKMNGNDLNPPLQIFRFPVKPGDSWNSATTIAGQSLKTSSTVSLQNVKVPAGNFQAALVTSEATTPQGRVINKQWFAPGIGLVKQEAQLSGATIVAELKKFEPAR